MEYLNKTKSGSFILNAPCWLSTRGSQWEIIWTVDKLWLKCLLWLYSNEPVLIDCYAMLCYAILYYYIYYNILHYKILLYYTTIILVLYHIFISACLCKTKFSYYLSLWGHFLILSFSMEKAHKQVSEIWPSISAKVLCLFCVVTDSGTGSPLDSVLKNLMHTTKQNLTVQNLL